MRKFREISEFQRISEIWMVRCHHWLSSMLCFWQAFIVLFAAGLIGMFASNVRNVVYRFHEFEECALKPTSNRVIA